MKLTLLAILAFFISCNKRGQFSCPDPQQQQQASIMWSGPIEADGCGWVVLIDSASHHPESLPARFQQNGMEVKICYELSGETYSCGFGALGMPVIRIRQIEER